MKYKDYYAILGVKREAGADDIKNAYRRLARKYHPDVSKEKDAEEKFKEMAEAYETLKDPEKRAAYDQLGSHAAGQEFRPPPDWEQQFAQRGGSFEDIDLSDLFAAFGAHGARERSESAAGPRRGHDYEAGVQISFDQAFNGTEISLEMNGLEWDENGNGRRVPRTISVRIPRGVGSGEKLRVPGKGGPDSAAALAGDLYLDIEVRGASAVSRRRTGHLRRSAACAMGSGPRHERLAADTGRQSVAQGTARHACRTTLAARRSRARARLGRARPPVRDRAHRSADGGRRRAARSLSQAGRAIDVQSPRPHGTGGRIMSNVPDPEEAVRIDDQGTLSYAELVAASGVPEQIVREMVSYGVLTPRGTDTTTWTFTTRSLVVVRKARRLQHDFELDTHAVTVVLRYLERIEALEAQLRSLRARLR